MGNGISEDSFASLAQAKPGDILLFSRPKGGIGVLISLITRSPHYHVALFEKDTHTIEARQRGVVRRDLRSKEGGHTWTVIPAPNGAGPHALDWARSQIGSGFDRIGLLVIILERVVRAFRIHYEPGKYTCAEFVALAYEKSGEHPDRVGAGPCTGRTDVAVEDRACARCEGPIRGCGFRCRWRGGQGLRGG